VIDVSKLTCKQFSAYNDDNKAIIMMWFEGYYTEDEEAPIIDFGKMASHLAQILIKCKDHPDQAVLELTDDVMQD
jgi:HdeA/HdeB family